MDQPHADDAMHVEIDGSVLPSRIPEILHAAAAEGALLGSQSFTPSGRSQQYARPWIEAVVGPEAICRVSSHSPQWTRFVSPKRRIPSRIQRYQATSASRKRPPPNGGSSEIAADTKKRRSERPRPTPNGGSNEIAADTTRRSE